MGHLENKVFDGIIKKPTLYVRYVDDIFLICQDISELLKLKDVFQENSVLSFTYELSNIQEELSFLDVMITKTVDGFRTGVYVKPTDAWVCMSGDGYCPDRYKKSVINSYL